MSKNVVLCLDGTSNEFCASNTNVVRLYQGLVHDPALQATYYHPGLGTMEAVGALTSTARKVTKLLGLAVGYGLEADVAAAYAFLMRNHAPEDRIYIFGFSRGAYTARALASLVKLYGLMRAGNEAMTLYALRLQSAFANRSKNANDLYALADEFRRTFAGDETKIDFVGTWDTVSSVGWISNPLKLPYTASNPAVSVARHAVSIDEHRAFFRQNLWKGSAGPSDLKQVWFPGDHCDVGGGHGDGDMAAKVALRWLAAEAEGYGLLIDPDRRSQAFGEPADEAVEAAFPLHESLRGWWRLAEFVPKKHWDGERGHAGWRMNRFRRRSMPDGALIHRSAWDRGAEYRSRFPLGATRVA